MNYCLQITAGRGPLECAWVIGRLTQEIIKEAQQKNIYVQLLEQIPASGENCFYSVSLLCRDLNFCQAWEGVVLWIGNSPFRPNHKRKNWYVGVSVITLPEQETYFRASDLKFETKRASGAGGQNINKVETSIKVTHLPSGLSATAQEERSQYQNKKLALCRLIKIFEAETQNAKAKIQKEKWQLHNSLQRGNPNLIYQGSEFKRIK